MIAVRRLLSGHHRSALSRECQRISEFHLLWQRATNLASRVVWFVLSYLRMLVNAVFFAADDWSSW